jgi:CO/xanthine dehydrogenase Mo-binding subunit/aerobic-type carbon monoxide dehydrogenase small subunit (CoxS/CutS family)
MPMNSMINNGRNISLSINAKKYSVEVSPDETLLHLLRERLGLRGTKVGCSLGECGSCIVVKDEKAVNACITFACDCDGSDITTIEGLALDSEHLHPLQESFITHGAVQCGFCTPGMIMSAKSLLDIDPIPTREEIKRSISGNLCRCTGYKKIIDAIESVARRTPPPSDQGESPIGRSIYRSDALEHVTGTAIFGADVTRPGMVCGKILRSDYAHARIRNIDTSSAEKLNGVLAVVTGKDVPEGYFGVDIKDQLVFARDKVRYRGDAVAAVAAVSEEIAAQALDLIKVDYEPLEPVFDIEEAVAPNAPIIHEKLLDYEINFETERKGNICTIANVKLGEVDKGFVDSDFIIEDEFTTQIQHQASMETHAALAEVDIHGQVTVWSTTQKPFAMRRYLSQALKMPMSGIRVIATKIGGGFGGKLELILEPYVVILAKKSRRPVQIVYPREEEFLATTPRHQTHFWVKSGIKNDGTLLARHVKLIYDTGAYSGNGPTTVTLSSQLVGGLYRIPNLLIEGICVYTNKMNCGSMRGPSGPQTTFAIESHMDNLAKKINMDPLDFRLINLLEKGEKTGVGQVLVDIDYKKVVKQAAEAVGWKKIKKEKNVGKGMACVFWVSGGWSTSATVKINEDGTVSLVTGAVDMGTGYLYTSVPQIVAEALGIQPEEVQIVLGDTDQTTYDHGIGGSRGAFTVGKVAQMAAIKAKEELIREAAKKLEISTDDLETKNGWIYPKGSAERGVSFAEISFARHIKEGGPVVGSAYFLPEMDPIDESRVKGLSFSAFKGNTIGCHAAVVRIIPETGHVEIEKYVAAHDIGKAINPRAVEGQIEGGVSMGLGFALTEKVMIGERGEVLNANFRDYKLPTSLDVPETEPVIVEIPAAYGPHGAKGLGEPTMAPPAAVISNAIYDAIGTRMRSTPMTPEKIRETIGKKKKPTDEC